jgi:hypothetical protein
MKIQHLVKYFLAAAQKDTRIKPLHISLFMAICWGGTSEKGTDDLTIFRKNIMPLARIASCATYHKYLKELVAFGYVCYRASNDYYSGSKISFPKKSVNYS